MVGKMLLIEPSSDAVFVSPYEFLNITSEHSLVCSVHSSKLGFQFLPHPLNVVGVAVRVLGVDKAYLQ